MSRLISIKSPKITPHIPKSKKLRYVALLCCRQKNSTRLRLSRCILISMVVNGTELMKQIYLYGTGSKALQWLPVLALHYRILAFVDSNKDRSGSYLLGLPVLHSSEINNKHCDLIVIASSFVEAIQGQLATDGCPAGIEIEQLPELQSQFEQYRDMMHHFRSQTFQHIPDIKLNVQHLSDAKLISDRHTLLELLPKHGICAELGVANGDFTEAIFTINQPKKLHLVDIWQSERYNDDLYNNVCRKFDNQLAAGQCQIHRKLSTDAVLDFPDSYFDWIYIDTTHSYKLTKEELTLYASKIKPGGVIAGHDYTMGNWRSQLRYGVMEAVHEFCQTAGYRIKYLTMNLSENQSFAIEKIM